MSEEEWSAETAVRFVKLKQRVDDLERLVRQVRDQHRGRFLQDAGDEETWIREANALLKMKGDRTSEEKASP